jgi:RNA polymerase sigma-70 factor (ECF subfamily)
MGALDAFTMLYERYLPVVYRRVRYVIPEPDVEDVTQEIFIAMLKSLKHFRYEAKFSTWLRTLVNRQVADYYRRRKPSDVYDPVDVSESESRPLMAWRDDQDAGAVDDAIILRQALQRLPGNYQEILLLRFVDGLRFEEIARLQDHSLEATKSLFRRAIATLQKQVIHV